jgi:iron complex outermembrane recepter protein
MRIKSYQYVLCVAAALGLSSAVSAFADVNSSTASSSSAAAPEVLGEIIVTARRVEERLQDVPISITVFNQAQLENHNLVNAQDLADYTPSLSASGFGNDNSTFAIRGFGQDIGTQPSVGVYFADVVAPRGNSSGITVGDGAGPGYFFDMANVQVLKGPQGTLFGRNTTGGAILFVPQKPTAELGGYVEASYGNYQMRRIQGALNLPLGDTVRLRIAVDDQRRDGYLNNDSGIGPQHLNDVNYTAVRASLVVDVTPNLENYTIASFTRSDTDGSVAKIFACDPGTFGGGFACPQLAREQQRGAGFYTVQSDQVHPESLLEQSQLINTTSWRAADTLTIKNIASFAVLHDSLRTPLFGTDWQLGGGLPPLVFSTVEQPPGKWTSSESTASEELQLQGSALENRLTYQGGIYLEATNPISYGGSQAPVFISCANAATFQCTDVIGIGASQQFGFAFPIHVGAVNYTVDETKYRNYGVYEQSTYSITDQLKATGGLRYTWDSVDDTNQRVTYQFPVLPPFTGGPTGSCTDAAAAPSCFESNKEKSQAPTWLFDLEYKPTNDIMAYGKYIRGYRAGGVFSNAPTNYRSFDPEKVDTYETGIKTTFGGPAPGTFNATAFYNNFRNQQLQLGFDAAPGAAVSPTTAILNAGKSRIWGVEIEATIMPVQGLTFDAAYTYLNTKITSIASVVSTDPNYVVASAAPVGAPLALSPKNKYVISGTYALPLPERIGRVSAGLTFRHEDRQLANYAYTNPVNVAAMGGDFGTLGARNLVDANAGWTSIAGSTFDFFLFGTNITNQHYIVGVAGLGSPGLGIEAETLGQPRLFGLRARYRFGK